MKLIGRPVPHKNKQESKRQEGCLKESKKFEVISIDISDRRVCAPSIVSAGISAPRCISLSYAHFACSSAIPTLHLPDALADGRHGRTDLVASRNPKGKRRVELSNARKLPPRRRRRSSKPIIRLCETSHRLARQEENALSGERKG